MSRQPKLERFNNLVKSKYQVYNSLFMTLPFHGITDTGVLLPLFDRICTRGYDKHYNPEKIVNYFFDKYQRDVSEEERYDLLFRFIQYIEAQNCHRLLYGTSSAKSATLSFWVKSSLTGTFAVMMYMEDGALNIGSTYTISSADTWEHKTITFVGNTSQAISHDNTIGLYVQFILMAGSSLVATDNTSWASYATGRFGYGHAQNGLATTDESTWQLTGVQFEVGEVATPFENESYGDTLRKCQRYYYTAGAGHTAYATTSIYAETFFKFPTEMRANPTIAVTNGTLTNCASVNTRYNTSSGFAVNLQPSSNGMVGFGTSGTAGSYTASAEL